MVQQRQLWPLVVGGLAIFAIGTVGKYALRAINAMEEDQKRRKNRSKDGEKDSAAQSDEQSPDQDDSPIRKDATPEQQAPAATERRRKTTVLTPSAAAFDVGSAYARVAVREGQDAKVLINSEGHRQTPVTIMIDGDKTIVGTVAKLQKHLKPQVVSYRAHLLLGKAKSEFLSNKKTALQDNLTVFDAAGLDGPLCFDFRGQCIQPVDLYTTILKNLNTSCTPNVSKLRFPICIAVPSGFTPLQRSEVTRAAKQAGLKNATTKSDAECAVAGAISSGIIIPEESNEFIVTVVDIGAAYTQLSAVRVSSGDSPSLVRTELLSGIGGDAFDDRFVADIAAAFQAEHSIDLSQDSMSRSRLYQAVEAAKFELANKLSAQINVPFITASASGPIHLDVNYSRSKYEASISPILGKLPAAMHLFLKSNADKSKYVLLVGGCARLPAVKSEIAKIASSEGISVVQSEEPESLISLGAASILRELSD
jgi:molecular chaperone DnaK